MEWHELRSTVSLFTLLFSTFFQLCKSYSFRSGLIHENADVLAMAFLGGLNILERQNVGDRKYAGGNQYQIDGRVNIGVYDDYQ
jgi:hypothetical protein